MKTLSSFTYAHECNSAIHKILDHWYRNRHPILQSAETVGLFSKIKIGKEEMTDVFVFRLGEWILIVFDKNDQCTWIGYKKYVKRIIDDRMQLAISPTEQIECPEYTAYLKEKAVDLFV